MPAPLTQEERTRLYCCFSACPQCGAERGEYCKPTARNRKVWTKGYHWMRGPRARFHGRLTPERKREYERLKAQIVGQREVVGHE